MSQIKQVKEASDIIQVIGERLQLQRTGSNWRALCPFHSESSPSFFVSEQFQRYKCFGCGESGDAFTFLEKYEGMTFSESLTYLAEKAGITLDSYKPSREDEQRARLLEICNLAKEYYHYLLTEHAAGEPARQYLKNRGVTTESIRLFQIGYAMDGWDGLIKYLHHKKKYPLAEIQDAGLIILGKGGRMYDRFRGRVMFPLTNHRGQVVGFSGRVLDPKAKEAKYINTPETMLYHKSQMLFGYSELYQEIRKKNEVIVVEGELDVISSSQAHVNNIVAIKGSALTTQHLQLISRVADKVLFSLDMDSAGVAATKRAIQLAQDMPLEMRVIMIPSGKDPDDLARTEPATWREAAKSSISIYEYLLRAALQAHDQDSPEGKREIINDLAPVFSSISHAVEQDVYIKKLAQALQVRDELVRGDIERFKRPASEKAAPRVAAAAPERKEGTRRQKLEIYLLYILCSSQEEQILQLAKELTEVPLVTPGAAALVKQISQQRPPFVLQSFIKQLPEDLRQLFFELSSDPEFEYVENVDWREEWKKAMTDLRQEHIRDQIQEIDALLEKLDSAGSLTAEQEAQQQKLLAEIVTLRQAEAFKK